MAKKNNQFENAKKQIEQNTDGTQGEDKYVPDTENYDYPKLEDVFGTDELKENLEEIIVNIDNEPIFQMMQTSAYKSFLFTGEPGNGKTFSAKAIRNTAIETNSVVWLPYDIGTYGTAYINMGAKNLQKFFDGANLAASYGYKVIMYFDEADVVMGKRGSSHTHKEDDKLLDCLMKNLQHINDYGESQYIIFSTNFPEAMDVASTRSGRIDKTIKFDKPDKNVRYQVFKAMTDKYNDKMRQDYNDNIRLFKKMNYNRLVDESKGFSMADIVSCYDRAIRSKVYEIIKQDTNKVAQLPQVGERDLVSEIMKVKVEKGHNYKGIGF
jgi:SpoVK/Ycf46/Vps4 family AAA+-type ATPase